MTYSSNIQNSSASYQPAKASTSFGINSASQSTNITNGLYKGQQLNGEVMDLRNEEVTVRLQDGRVLNAKMEDNSALSIGDKVNFKVLDVSNSNLTLKLISDNANSSLGQILDRALDAAGLSKNSRNREIVGELLKQQMSIDKNTINMLIKQSMAFKDTPITTLVLLHKYQLPVTKENLRLFEEYEKNAHNIYHDLEHMASAVTELFQSFGGTEEAYIKESKQLLQTLFSGRNENQLTLSKESITELNQLLSSQVDATVKEFINSTTLLSNGMLTVEQAKELVGKVSNLPLSILPIELEQLMDYINASPSPSPMINTSLPAADRVNSTIGSDTQGESNPFHTMHGSTINHLDLAGEPSNELFKPQDGLTKIDLNFLHDLKKYHISPDLLTHMGNRSELLSHFMNHLDSFDVEIAKTLLNSKDFKEILKDELLSKWSLSPNEMADKNRVDSYLEVLEKDIKNLSNFLEQTYFANGVKVGGQASHLTDNINFMNQLNQFFTYTQIPIKLNTGYTKSELYVYSKRKRSSENESGVSVLLHLNMNYLGPLDIYVKLDKNQVDSTFYCDNENIISLISNHINILTNNLTAKGFHINTSVEARTKTVNVIKEILEEDSSASSGIRYNFDVRA